MITTTTQIIEGQPVKHYLGIVSAQSIIGANIFKDLLAGLRDLAGGRSDTYEQVVDEARTNAMRELVQKAESIGANAIVGIHLNFQSLGGGSNMLMVLATGTAVRV